MLINISTLVLKLFEISQKCINYIFNYVFFVSLSPFFKRIAENVIFEENQFLVTTFVLLFIRSFLLIVGTVDRDIIWRVFGIFKAYRQNILKSNDFTTNFHLKNLVDVVRFTDRQETNDFIFLKVFFGLV